MKFRKKPVVIEAIQWRCQAPEYHINNFSEILTWAGENNVFLCIWKGLLIKTLEGEMQAKNMDWIIKGVNGEFYPCKPDIFEKTYEPVDSATKGE